MVRTPLPSGWPQVSMNDEGSGRSIAHTSYVEVELGGDKVRAASGHVSCRDHEGLGLGLLAREQPSPTFRLRMTRLGSLSTCSSSSGFRTLHWRR